MFSGLLLAAEGRKSALYPRLKETRLYGAKGKMVHVHIRGREAMLFLLYLSPPRDLSNRDRGTGTVGKNRHESNSSRAFFRAALSCRNFD